MRYNVVKVNSMFKWLKRILCIVPLAVVCFSLFIVPVSATEVPSTTASIDYVYAYQHYLEAGDQLYLIGYTWDYSGVYPDDYPVETATEAIIIRLMNGSTELGSTSPYAYYRLGYGSGIAAIYFSAADAPTWNQPYTVKIEGNPLLTWTGGSRPNVSQSTFDLWSTSTSVGATAAELWARIQLLAIDLGTKWGTDLIENLGGTNYFTDYGEDYFPSIIPSLRSAIPNAFASQALRATFNREDKGTGYAEDLKSAVEGTIFDWDDLGTKLGVAGTVLLAVAYCAVSIYAVYMGLQYIGSYKPAVLLILVPILVGSKIGILPLMASVMMGVGGAAVTVWALLFDRASA
jgi:hypothetical protein